MGGSHTEGGAPDKPLLPVWAGKILEPFFFLPALARLYRGNLNYKKAALLLYGLQIASINLRHLQLAPAPGLERVDL